uniref:CSON011800 protein n=1 Tax=Culicoides sonorensis TaxID=179676 RepID=A0A336M9F3_CULSO
MDYKKLAQILLEITTLLTVIGQISSFGYDSGGACDPNASRKGRAQIIASIPCDLSTQSYCNLPGNAYPWHAVRRFVHENQGLMKRMYGDIRQISVMKTEFDGNYLETDEFESASERYSEKRYRAMKFNKDQGLNKKNRKSDTIMEPHFRLQSTSTTTANPSTTTTTTGIKTTSRTTIEMSSTSKKPLTGHSNSKDYYLLTNNETDFEIETNKVNTGNDSASFEETESVTVITLPSNPNSISDEEEVEISSTTNKMTLNSEIQNTTEGNHLSNPEPYLGSESEESDEHEDENDTLVTSDEDEEDVTPTVKGQLFQDTVEKEVIKPNINMRGVNACPVKEEVVAPFWANNTRGETLALLNLYPFEQYVHWEKCTNEHKQMFCRDGCRCEQQFSLHRLLAYDPHNECRGIFSDWFKFPSCCICKCYDIPFDYRVTSRSPRSITEKKKSPLDEAEANLHQAIYEHSANEFYRPKEFNVFDEEEFD